MATANCPSVQELADFNLGLLDDDRIESVGNHLDHCSKCRAALAEPISDPLCEQIRQANAPSDATLEAELRRACELVENLVKGSMPVGPTTPDGDIESEVGEVLTPSGSPGEIGRLGPYRILEVLGQGGMGIVFRAVDPRLRRTVAVKVLRPHLARQRLMRERFSAEARAMAAMRHEHIIPVYDIGESEGKPYFTMAHITGTSLAREVAAGPLLPLRAAGLVRAVCRAIAFSHEQGIVHRDLKPANLLVDSADHVFVTDFGLAKQSDPDEQGLTQTGQVLGTPQFMSPEQAKGEADLIGPSTDVYALGATLYCLLTGRPPFQAATVLATLEQVAQLEPVAPHQLNPAVPRDLDTICLKCLEKAPQNRYASAATLADDIDCFLAGRPIAARPIGLPGRLARWARRNPALALLSSSVALLLLAITVASILSAIYFDHLASSERSARKREGEQRQLADLAHQERKQTLTDMYTASGLFAAREDPRLALLWFAHAARQAGDDRERAEANRIRVATWSRTAWQPVFAVRHTAQSLHRVIVHPAGRHLLTQGFHGRKHGVSYRMWDIVTEKEVPFPGNPGTVTAVAWNPKGDCLVVAGSRGEVTFHRFPIGGSPQRVALPQPVTVLHFSADGQLCALAYGNRVRVWDCDRGLFATTEWVFSDRVTTLAIDPQGELLAIGCQDNTCQVVAIRNGDDAPLFTPVPHAGLDPPRANAAIVPPLFVRGGKSLLTLSQGEATCYDPRTGKVQRTLGAGRSPSSLFSPGQLDTAALSQDGNHLFWSGERFNAIFETATGRPTSPDLPHRPARTIHCAAFGPDGRTLVTGCGDHAVRFWSVPDGAPLGIPLFQPNPVTAVTYCPDGRLITGEEGGLVRIWSRPNANPVDHCIPTGGLCNIHLSADGRYLVPTGHTRMTANVENTQIYDVVTGQPAGPVLSSGGLLHDAALSPDGRQLAMAASNGTRRERRTNIHQRTGQLLFWDWKSGQRLYEPIEFSSEVRKVDFRPDGRELAVFVADGTIAIIDPSTGKMLRRWQLDVAGVGASSDLYNGAVRYSPDGLTLASFATGPIPAQIWDAATGRPVAVLEKESNCVDLAFTPDSRFAATISLHGQARVWDLVSGSLLMSKAHPARLFAVRFSRDGQYLLTGGADSMARVWDWRSGTLVCPPCLHEHDVIGVAFAMQEHHVISCSADSIVKIWEWRTGKIVCPPIRIGGPGRLLEVSPDGLRLACSGGPLSVIHLGKALARLPIENEALCDWAEIVSGQRVEGSGTTILTSNEWLQRWRAFRGRYPAMQIPGEGN